jgi:transcriptional regulator with XRE-family HTH domain
MKENQNPYSSQSNSVLKYFGSELARLRERAGMSQPQFAKIICYSVDLLRSVEQGRRIPTVEFAQQCDRALDSGGALGRIWQLVHEERVPAWLRDFAAMEEAATELRSFEMQCFPGLLQTEDYVRSVMSVGRTKTDHELIEGAISARLARQQVLQRSKPPQFWALIDEGLLHRAVGGRNVMRQQLQHLLDVSDPPAVVVQVLPYEASMTAPPTGPFLGLSFEDSPDVLFSDSVIGPGLFITDPVRVKRGNVMFDLLRAAALPTDASEARIIEAIKEI